MSIELAVFHDEVGPETPVPIITPEWITKCGCVASKTALDIPAGLDPLQWKMVLGNVLQIVARSQWWIGDLLVYGDAKWGAGARQAIESMDYEYGTLANFKYVSQAVDISRRHENLTFSHHAEVASQMPADQTKWLDLAEKNLWSTSELRVAIRKAGADKQIENGKPIKTIAQPIGTLISELREWEAWEQPRREQVVEDLRPVVRIFLAMGGRVE